jgi:hypothetical protein
MCTSRIILPLYNYIMLYNDNFCIKLFNQILVITNI